jgi:hypothetical protein
VNLERFLTSEAWKKTAFAGLLLTAVAITRYGITGEDIPAGVVSLIGVLIFGAAIHQVGKRATHWRPTEEARAEQMRNGGELPGPGGGLAG